MVHQIIKSKYRVFIETFILALLILFIGGLLGFYIEYSRLNALESDYRNFEVESLDLKLQNYYFQIMDRASCDEAIRQNFIFADDIYDKGLVIERYEEANQITDELKQEKKKYVLLKTELWLNSILLKEKCGNESFDTLVYLYSDVNNDKIKETQQAALSNVLREIKEEKGNKIILLPIAGNLGLNAIELQKRVYNVTYLPSIIINEKYVLDGFHTKEELESYL